MNKRDVSKQTESARESASRGGEPPVSWRPVSGSAVSGSAVPGPLASGRPASSPTHGVDIPNPPEADPLSFEEALRQLEQIVRQLEDGQVGLGEALSGYERGIWYLKYCHGVLEQAERKIALLSGIDAQGQPLTECFDAEHMSLEEKADNRSRRRRPPPRGRPADGAAGIGDAPQPPEHMDRHGGLF